MLLHVWDLLFFFPEFWWERKPALRLKLHSKAWDSFFHLECGSYVFWSFLECPEPSHSFAIGVLMAGGGDQFLHTPISKLSAYQPVVSDLKRHLFLILYTKEEPHNNLSCSRCPNSSTEENGWKSESQSSQSLDSSWILFLFCPTKEILIQQVLRRTWQSVFCFVLLMLFLVNAPSYSDAIGPKIPHFRRGVWLI